MDIRVFREGEIWVAFFSPAWFIMQYMICDTVRYCQSYEKQQQAPGEYIVVPILYVFARN